MTDPPDKTQLTPCFSYTQDQAGLCTRHMSDGVHIASKTKHTITATQNKYRASMAQTIPSYCIMRSYNQNMSETVENKVTFGDTIVSFHCFLIR